MITKEQEYALVNKYKSHSELVVRRNQKQFLPVFNTGKIFCTNKYHYMDKWYGYAYSVEEPDKAYTILYVENMPYKSLYKRKEKSFTTSIEKMVFDNELVPFLLFVNNRFVSWNNIDIIYDNGDTYLKLHGTKYYKDLIKKIDMMILPYNVSYLEEESEYTFNTNFNALSSYINQSAIVKDGTIFINLPDTNTDYTYDRYTYNIGFWVLKQYKLRCLGVLSQDRIDKLRAIPVVKKAFIDGYEQTLNTTVNMFDKDSYNNIHGDSIVNITKDNIIFKFNNNGELDDNGKSILYLVDKDEVKYDIFKDLYIGRGNDIVESVDGSLESSLEYYLGNIKFSSTEDYLNDPYTLFRENFIIFKNGCLCTDCGFDVGKYNNFKVYDIDKTKDYTSDGQLITDNNTDTKLIVYAFRGNSDHIINHIDQFNNNNYIKNYMTGVFMSGQDNLGYSKMMGESLSFDIDNSKVYEEAFDEAVNEVLEYNPLLFNPLYTEFIHSVCYTGEEINGLISSIIKTKYIHQGRKDSNGNPKPDKIEFEEKGLKIPRMRFDKDHETYPMIFVNGELISNYNELKVYTNYLFLPIQNEFKVSDIIEVLYISGINNNEIPIGEFKDIDHCCSSVIPKEELRIFSTDVQDLLEYQEPDYDFDSIAFPVYKRTYTVNEVNGLEFKLHTKLGEIIYDKYVSIDDNFIGRKCTAVSCRKFAYQRLVIDRKAYKVLLDKRFKYCDNQKQYCLFINGRVVPDDEYLITIPKLDRPFDNMYIYSAKFFKPTDRIDLFYLPQEFFSINQDQSIKVQSNGYIECDKRILKHPLSKELYMFFINGKKIPKDDIINVSTNMVRIARDTNTTDTLNIFPIVEDDIAEVTEYIDGINTKSKYESMIDFIKNNNSLGYDELDRLFNEYVKISNIEDPISADVARIAIINEIVRDFWVTNGYDYNAHPFIYDYELDDYITKDENGNYIIPALDALPNINIIKYDLHHLYFIIENYTDANNPKGEVCIEFGDKIENPVFKWGYNDNYNTEEIEYQKLNGIDVPIIDDYEYEYHSNLVVDMNSNVKEFKLEAFNGFNTCESTITVRFTNAIYYGLVDEDLIDYRNSDIYSKNLDNLIKSLNKVLKTTRDLDLNNYVIGNNKYFVFAAPKRLVYDKDGMLAITFFLPDINSSEVLKAIYDDKTTPILTDGTYEAGKDLSFNGNLKQLNKYEMKKLEPVMYTNQYGYTEEYIVFITNGYFTRLYDNIGFDIKIR